MEQKQKYKTKQKSILTDYLQTMAGKHVTVGDICAYFQAQGNPIGQATVYRHLEGMVNEGIVNKYMIDGTSPACFEYTGSACHEDPESCFHCKCEICGRLFHVHCRELEGIGEHLYEHHHFRLNPYRTVFYGVCEDCRGEGGSEDFSRTAGSDGVRESCCGAAGRDGVSDHCCGAAGRGGVSDHCCGAADRNGAEKKCSENKEGESRWHC